MKRLLIFISVLGFLVCFPDLKAQDNLKMPDAVAREHNKIKVAVLPQIELISIVQTIGKYPTVFGFLMAKDSSSYKNDVITHFGIYKTHPAVLMFDRLCMQPRMLNFSAPSNIMLYTNEYLNLRTDIKSDGFVISRAGGVDSLKLFLTLLRDFAKKSSFNSFYQEHRNYYLSIVENTIKNIGPVNYISELESFFGKSQKSYDITLVSLYNYVGFGNSLLCSDGKLEIYNTMGPRSIVNQIPFFGDENYLKFMIRHEFSHPFVNPLTEKNWDYIKGDSARYDLIPEVARKNVCGDWQECINEFTIRAITTHMAYNEADSLGLLSYNMEMAHGVSYMDAILERLKAYQSDRVKYPTFESFYPAVLDVFKNQ